MVEVQNVGLPPPWLRVLLTQDFYGPNNFCKTHKSQYESYFCKECMNDTFCQYCLDESVHKEHKTVRVFKVSEKASMSIEDLSRIWSIQYIQPFRINSRTVIYLHERQNKGPTGCSLCKGVMVDNKKYKFCSIECQMKSIINNGNGVFDPRQDNDAPVSSLNGRLSNGSPQMIRKANRPLGARWRSPKTHKAARAVKPASVVQEHHKTVAGNEAARDTVVPVRRHRRKGIPRRAYLF